MAKSSPSAQRILALDIGGTGLKAGVIDGNGKLVGKPLWLQTPHRPAPKKLVKKLVELTAAVPKSGYARVAAGFPGVIRRGVVLTSPTLGNPKLNGFNLEKALAAALGKPVRLVNDAEMQGYGTIRSQGLEMVVTLGTGFGSALFLDGQSTPHLELSTHEFRHYETYNQQLGKAALDRIGKRKWNHRVLKMIESLEALVHFDHLYIGGGNSDKVSFKLPRHVSLTPNVNGLKGGAWVWKKGSEASPR